MKQLNAELRNVSRDASRQQQTFNRGAAVDLKIGGSSSTTSSYVAITRVERRKDLWMFRPLPIDLFIQGQQPSIELVLKVWRREYIDLESYRERTDTATDVSRMRHSQIQRMLCPSTVGHTTKAREFLKHASNCAKTKTPRLIAVGVGSAKEKQHLHLTIAVHTPRRREYVWIV